MRSFIIALTIIVISVTHVFAQQYRIEKSAGFEEPENGWNKVLQLRNGNTLFFHMENKVGFSIIAYDKTRKEIARKTITSQLWDPRRLDEGAIAGLYDINGEAVIFLTQIDNNLKLSLYRLRISATTAEIIKEDVAGSFAPVKDYKKSTVDLVYSKIYVEKDPASDCYAIIYRKIPARPKDYLHVQHYNEKHEILTDADYCTISDSFSSLYYIGCIVDGDKRLFITTNMTIEKPGDTVSGFAVSCLRSGEKIFHHHVTAIKQEFSDVNGVMLYNHSTNTIQLLTILLTKQSTKSNFLIDRSKTTSTYQTVLFYINPDDLNISHTTVFNAEKVEEYIKNKIDPDRSFHGLPQQMIINKNNTTTIISEETRTQSMTRNGALVREDSYIGVTGISQLSENGAEISGFAFNKNQMTQGALQKFYIADRAKGQYIPPPTYFGFSRTFYFRQFISADYLFTPGGQYVLFNDLPVNYEKGEDEPKRKLLNSVTESNVICCKLGDNKVEKFYLFGEPDKYRTIYCYITSSDFDRNNYTYATLMVEHIGRKKEAKIAWVTFE